MTWTCGHCAEPVGREQRYDSDEAGMPFPACHECTDLAVLGAWCLACNDRTTLPGCPPAPRHVYKPGTIQLEDPSPIRQAEWVRRLAENAREITR